MLALHYTGSLSFLCITCTLQDWTEEGKSA